MIWIHDSWLLTNESAWEKVEKLPQFRKIIQNIRQKSEHRMSRRTTIANLLFSKWRLKCWLGLLWCLSRTSLLSLFNVRTKFLLRTEDILKSWSPLTWTLGATSGTTTFLSLAAFLLSFLLSFFFFFSSAKGSISHSWFYPWWMLYWRTFFPSSAFPPAISKALFPAWVLIR